MPPQTAESAREDPPESYDLADVLRWRMLDGSGWQVLLPPGPCERLLCYDTLDGATMLLAARLAREVVVVHHDRGQLDKLEALATGAGLGGLRFHDGAVGPAGLHGWPRPAPAGSFDGALVHDPAGLALRRGRGPTPAIDELCAALAGAVRADGGFIYLGVRNRFGYTRLREREGAGPLLSSAAARRALRRAATQVDAYPYLVHGARLLQIVPATGYRSNQNSFLRSERMRELVLRGAGLRHLAPVYGLVGWRGHPRQRWLDCLLADEWVQSFAPQATLRRCLVLNHGKLALSVGAPHETHGTHVIVVTPDAVSAARRRAEARWLQRLPAAFSHSVPAYLGEREVAGVTVFALSELPGITVDTETPLGPALTRSAAAWLREFHRATARSTLLTPAIVEQLAGRAFAGARERYAPLADELGRLEQALRARLGGLSLPLVFMHGDFKLENIVFDVAHAKLTGVIDWELAQEPGPPLLDLLYLLAYNRIVARPDASLELIAAAAAGREWRPEERALVDEYCGGLEGCGPAERALGALFALHHVGVRQMYDLRVVDTLARLRRLLSVVHAALVEPPLR